jgi:hypothetical protein
MQTQTHNISNMFIYMCLIAITCTAAPFNSNNYNSRNTRNIPDDCCNDELGVDTENMNNYNDNNNKEYAEFNSFEEMRDDTDNLLYIPFNEHTINDFGIHKYVISRNIKSMISYHFDSHLMNIIQNSINQSSHEINNLVVANIAEFDAMAKNKFISNFLDFWCAYRIMQLTEFAAENEDMLNNMFNPVYFK